LPSTSASVRRQCFDATDPAELVGIRLASNVLRFRASEIESWLEECSQPVRPIALREDSGREVET
jgi:hypothetical protein